MLNECAFYEGTSGYFKVRKGQHKRIDLTLCKVCACTPTRIAFRGRVLDGCRERSLEDVLVTIRVGALKRSAFTNMYGDFKIELPNHEHTVQIRFDKHGYRTRSIEMYRIKHDCKNYFYLCEE